MKNLIDAILFLCILHICTYAQLGPYSKFGPSHKSKFASQEIFTISELDSFITATMEEYHIAGYSACIFNDGKLIWNGNYGFADATNKIAVSDSTIFMMASVSKLLVTTAIIQLWEEGLFDLDDDINNYLPVHMQFKNPFWPNDIITFRMLLTHSSAIGDNWDVLNSLTSVGDSPIPLDSFFVNYLTPTGKWYNAIANFYIWQPGSTSSYSNVGFSLLAFLIEQLSGKDFNEYCRENILNALNMNESAWLLSELDTSRISFRHVWNGSGYTNYPHDGSPLYPVGWLRTNCLDLANFLITYMENGVYDTYMILKPSSIDTIFIRYFYNIFSGDYQGLGWFESKIANSWLWGHTGGWIGVVTGLFYDIEDKWGFIGISNTGYQDESADGSLLILEKLAEIAYNMSTNLVENRERTPSGYILSQNYPNPFNPSTTIEFDLPTTSDVTLKIYNILGEEISIIVSDQLSAGSYSFEWDASKLASGVYLYRLHADDYVETRKMVLMR
jgi:CubicO group peptidase (beta-lactamase class C family)